MSPTISSRLPRARATDDGFRFEPASERGRFGLVLSSIIDYLFSQGMGFVRGVEDGEDR